MRKSIGILLLIALSLLSCGEKNEDIVNTQFIQKESSIVIFANVHELFATKGILKALRNNKDFNNLKKELIKNANINIEKDIKKISITQNKANNNMAIYANLNYNKEKTLEAIKTNKNIKHIKIMNYDVLTGYKIKSPNTNNLKAAIALINDKNIIITEEKNIKQHLDIINDKGNNINTEDTLYKEIKQVEDYNIFWGIITLNDALKNTLFKAMRKQRLLNRYIESMRILKIAAERKDTKANILISSTNKNIKEAKLLHSYLNNILNLVKSLFPPSSNEGKVLKSLNLTQKGSELIIKISADEKQLEGILVKNAK